jgi:hypothetical protein
MFFRWLQTYTEYMKHVRQVFDGTGGILEMLTYYKMKSRRQSALAQCFFHIPTQGYYVRKTRMRIFCKSSLFQLTFNKSVQPWQLRLKPVLHTQLISPPDSIKCWDKGKIHSIIGHKSPDGEESYKSIYSLTPTLDGWMFNATPRPPYPPPSSDPVAVV